MLRIHKRRIMKEKIADYITKTSMWTISPEAVTKLNNKQTGMEVYAVQASSVTILVSVRDEEITIKECNW